MRKFVLKWDAMKKWPIVLWIVSVALILITLGFMGYFMYAYWICGMFFWYMGWCILIVVVLVLITVIVRKTHRLHMHHYTVGMIILLTVGYQSIPAAILSGFSNGMMIEGGARWGYDPVWVRKKPKAPKTTTVQPAAVESDVKQAEADG